MDFMRFVFYFTGMGLCLLLFVFLNRQKPTGLVKSVQFGLIVLILIILVMILSQR